MEKVKIFVCCHKEGFCLKNQVYEPIQVGRALSAKKLDMIGDDTGDNISAKNPNYCELTAQYWIWKNVKDAEYVGLCHYRRYLDLSCHAKYRKNTFVSEDEMQKNAEVGTKIMEKYDIVVSKPLVEVISLKDSYCMNHISTDYFTMEKVIEDLYPDYIDSFHHVMSQNNQYSMGNILVTSKKIFDEYSEWLFDILFEVEKRIEISKDPYQARVFGFMSERLMNVYIYHHRLKVLERAVMTVDNQPNPSVIHSIAGVFVRNLLFRVNNTILK